MNRYINQEFANSKYLFGLAEELILQLKKRKAALYISSNFTENVTI